MPEIAEVECARRLLEAQCIGKKITLVNAADDDKVFEGLSPTQISSALLHKTPLAARRLGKHCWLDFGPTSPALLLHLGMTGGTVVKGKGGAYYQRYSVDDSQWPPRFVKLELHFEDGTQWAFSDSRRFARIRLLKDPLNVPPLSQLGWDPLLSWPPLETFTESLVKQRRAIKALLLDQSFSAGVGNWIADEVLYQCRIHPEQPANTLTTQQAQQLHFWIHEVCRIASDVDADSDRLPESWLFHHRWNKGKANSSKINGHVIDHVTVGGRTSAYVPALQKLVKSAKPSLKKGEVAGAVAVRGEEPSKSKIVKNPATKKATSQTKPKAKAPLAVTPPVATAKRVARSARTTTTAAVGGARAKGALRI